MERDHLEIFKELSRKALEEEDNDAFLEILLKRDLSSQHLLEKNVRVDEETAETLFHMEEKIRERLEEERIKLFREMEKLSQSRKVAAKYTPKFPFPSMPAFFDKKG